MRREWLVAADAGVALLVVLILLGCTPVAPVAGPATLSQSPPPIEPSVVTARPTDTTWAALETLPIKGRAPMTGYDRTDEGQWGPRWADVDRSGCDQRNDVLIRDLDGETLKPGTHGCVVLTGTLHDRYTGKTIPFTRGRTTSDDVQIDHVVSLGNAWATGAQQLDDGQRLHLANDLMNLQATEGRINQQKSDSDYATWKPPDRAYWCTFVARQVQVKVTYHLWVTQPEHDAMVETLATCPEQELPQ